MICRTLPGLPRSLPLRPVHVRRWRRRRLEIVSLRPSPRMRPPPGCFNPGTSLQDQDAAASVILHGSSFALGVARTRLHRNHVSCPGISACYAAGCPRRTSRTYRTLPRILPRRPYTCTTTCSSCSSRHWLALSYPPRFCGVFASATPPFAQPAGTPVPPSAPGLTSVASTVTQPDAANTSQVPSQDMFQSWKEEFIRDMKTCWDQFVSDAPPQPTVGPAVPSANMGPDSLQQLSSSDDREALRAQRKAGSKWADSSVRQSSRSSERSSADRHRARVRHRQVSPDSSSPTRRLSPPAKRSQLGSRHVPRGSSSSEGCERSPRARLPRRSRSPVPCRRGPSPSSSSHHRRSRDSPAPSRWPLEAGRTRRLAGPPSLSPRRRSPACHRRSRRSFQGCQSSPSFRTRAPNRHSPLSSSRSPSPQGRRTCSLSSRRQRSRLSSRDCISRPHAADQRLLRLRVDDGDQHPRDSPIPDQSKTVDDSQLSADMVQKLFADLLDPPALSHYADPLPDSTPSNQLAPYDRTTSSSAAPRVSNIEPLDTHGLFQNYQSFHRLSGDQDKEACTAACHDITNLMLSQTSEEASLINVSSSRPKPEGPYPSQLAATDELKKKQDKIHLQWPPLKDNNKVIQRTLGLYQHGPQPKSGTSNQWPPPPAQNLWDKEFIPKDFPTTHKIPSTMPKRWDLHASSPLMLRPPQSTAVMEVPDSEITKHPSWLEAFAARSAHTSSMSATSMVGVYNFLQKITRFLRASAAKDNIQNNITLVDDLIQRANSMALEAHLMVYDAGVTSTELFTHLHMLRRRTVLESPTVDLPQRDKDRLLVMSVGGNDLFAPDARKVHEWKRDTKEEKVKLISRVFDEREQRDKAKNKPSSSDSRPPRSLSHRSPLESISRPRPKDSYNQQPGQSFRRPPKQSPYKSRTGAQSKSQTFNRDKKTSSSHPSDNRDQG